MTYLNDSWVKMLTGVFGAISDSHRKKLSVRLFCKIVKLKQTSEAVCLLMYKLVPLWSTLYAVTVLLGRQKMS